MWPSPGTLPPSSPSQCLWGVCLVSGSVRASTVSKVKETQGWQNGCGLQLLPSLCAPHSCSYHLRTIASPYGAVVDKNKIRIPPLHVAEICHLAYVASRPRAKAEPADAAPPACSPTPVYGRGRCVPSSGHGQVSSHCTFNICFPLGYIL